MSFELCHVSDLKLIAYEEVWILAFGCEYRAESPPCRGLLEKVNHLLVMIDIFGIRPSMGDVLPIPFQPILGRSRVSFV